MVKTDMKAKPVLYTRLTPELNERMERVILEDPTIRNKAHFGERAVQLMVEHSERSRQTELPMGDNGRN